MLVKVPRAIYNYLVYLIYLNLGNLYVPYIRMRPILKYPRLCTKLHILLLDEPVKKLAPQVFFLK